jgi:uncharacterized membrane protein HdeD (DUF308 family)
MSNNSDSQTIDWRTRALNAQRGWVLTAGIVSILLGVFVLIRPDAGLTIIGVIFGLYLIIAGVGRFAFAIADSERSAGSRVFKAIIGILIVVAGVFCLFNVFGSVKLLAIILGIGLVLAGIADLFNFDRDAARPTWMRVTAGILAIIGGIIMFIIPVFAVSVIVVIAAIILIIVGIVSLATLPSRDSIV